MKLPTLYKKTSTGAIQFWEIEDVPQHTSCGDASIIVTRYGQLGTDSPQTTQDLIGEGKNVGKKNATTAVQQAALEAQAKWEKQKKKGYVDSLEGAQADELDDLIEGGIVPMLAHSYVDVIYDMRPGHELDPPQYIRTKESKKIKFPALMQPKLDGIRCTANLKNGKCTLWTRTRKPITSMPHINRAIENGFPSLLANVELVLDGELYNHSLKKSATVQEVEIEEGTISRSASDVNFEKIVSLVRQEEPGEGHEVIQYHVYDIPNDKVFSQRATAIRYIKSNWFPNGELQKVDTVQVNSDEEAMAMFEQWRKEGYEGAMIRNMDSKYVNKRSYDLQKLKEFNDAEFEIIGIEEGRGKLTGHVGSFVCRTGDGKEFLAKMSGDTDLLKDYFEDHSLWKGKQLTVRYQGLTGANGVPRFPIGIAFRDYE